MGIEAHVVVLFGGDGVALFGGDGVEVVAADDFVG
jgi:hypothetical protein